MITLHVEPKQAPMTWEEFIKTKPKFSLALDGYVNTGPRFAPDGPYMNANHHEDVDRLATRATCAQILIAIRQGLFSAFRKNSEAHVEVYVNDCDEDVCTSWFLLKNFYMVENSMNPQVNKLVHLEDMLDATAGTYSLPADLPTIRKLAWVFYPYRSFRLNGGLSNKNEEDYREIISDVERRIMSFINGAAEEMHLDCNYKVVGGGPEWKLVNEIGAHARHGMLSDGIRAYVSVRPRANETFTYTIGKTSPFINFDVNGLLTELNKAEFSNQKDIKDIWGGGNLIGGSPRVNGSKLKPSEVESIINNFIKKTNKE